MKVFNVVAVSRRNVSKRKHLKLTDFVQSGARVLPCQQMYDHFLVIDFEATCERKDSIIKYDQEIIEFPAFKVNSSTFEIENAFHSFVRPTLNPTLSDFSTQLTGITQTEIDNQPTIKEVLDLFHSWMENHILCHNKKFIFCTSGDWDLMKMLPNECKTKNLFLPKYFYPYINVNKSFALTMGKWPRQGKGRLHAMMHLLDIKISGELHQGTSDCKNIILVMKELAKRGHIFKPTSDA